MIPRTLVPVDARPPAQNGAEPSTRRRPTSLDERTLVPAMLPIVVLDGRSTIPANLPLDSISARVVVPRDINREAYGVVEDHSIPLQPTEMDERVTVPVGSKAPEIVAPAEFSPPDIVSPDVFTSGEVHLVTERVKEESTKWDAIKLVASISFHILLIFAFIQFFARRAPSPRDEEIARRFTPLVAPGSFDLEQPKAPVSAPSHIKVDPRVVAKVAPPAPKVETPKIPDPPRELPAAPVPKTTAQQPALDNAPAPKSDTPKPKQPLQLEIPDVPTPNSHLQLPTAATSGTSLNDLLHGGGERPSGPAAIVGGGAVHPGGQGRGGAGYGGLEMLTPTEGVDFSGYLQRVYLTVKRNWFAVMPGSVELGEKGIVQLTFRIYRDGTVHSEDPQIQRNSGKEPLDRAAYSSIRASNPFDQLPPQFSGPYIELRYTYFYNILPSSLGQ